MADSTQMDEYYIRATSAPIDDRARVLKQGDTFAVFDRYGDIPGFGEHGLFHEDTRFLSRLTLRVGGRLPHPLSSTIKEDNAMLTVDLSNPEMDLNEVVVPQGTVHLRRAIFLWQRTCWERLEVFNFGVEPVHLALSYEFEADFRDIFELRGSTRLRRGVQEAARVGRSDVVMTYRGLDDRQRTTRLIFSPEPASISDASVQFEAELAPQERRIFHLTVSCSSEEHGDAAPAPVSLRYDDALSGATLALHKAWGKPCRIVTSNAQFNAWLDRGLADLQMMVTETPNGPFPYAGVPWFSTPFGRDGIITALETLWVNPEIAAGVIRYLAATQATELNPERDAEPGKILHETRKGEMAALGEIPFGRYYGSVDGTPLFVLLAGAYYEATGDRGLLQEIWPNVERALAWIDDFGDPDGDGFVEYARQHERGLVHQGWKDSADSVFHRDGSPAEGPIALCEVQGYVYAAKRGAARVARVLGHAERAVALEEQAARLRTQFDAAFWDEEIGSYALALDGRKRQCQVRSSNAGHCLFAGIALPERAERVARTLLDEDSFSGWGVRTVSEGEARYNPMSYHNGSVWPHDNALVAQGLARYGFKDAALRVLGGIFDASVSVELHRLPELFAGFQRRAGEGPTRYPVANSPQSWAAGAVFMLLGACLGLSVSAPRMQVQLNRPVLPPFLEAVRIENLRVGDGSLDLELHRYPEDVGIIVTRRVGDVEVLATK